MGLQCRLSSMLCRKKTRYVHDAKEYHKRLKRFQIFKKWMDYFAYTSSLAPAVLTCSHFQKVFQISSFCNFHYITEGILSLMRFWLLCIDFSAPNLVHGIFTRPKKCSTQGLGVSYFVFPANFSVHKQPTTS